MIKLTSVAAIQKEPVKGAKAEARIVHRNPGPFCRSMEEE